MDESQNFCRAVLARPLTHEVHAIPRKKEDRSRVRKGQWSILYRPLTVKLLLHGGHIAAAAATLVTTAAF